MFSKKHIASSFLLIIILITSLNVAQTSDLILKDTTIISTVIFEAANSITTDSNFVIATTGNVTFNSGGTVTINPIFTIHTGGIFQLFTNAAVDVEEEKEVIPVEYFLHQNFPNPFNPSTMVKYGIPEKSNVKIEIFNMLGQSVGLLVNSENSAGYYEIIWNASNLPSGIYIISIKAMGVNFKKNFTEVKKALLLK